MYEAVGELAVGEPKLDGVFITGLGTGYRERDLEPVRATTDLGPAMRLRVVAACREDEATIDLLRDVGCDLGQGYFVSRPLPADGLVFGSVGSDAPVLRGSSPLDPLGVSAGGS